MTNGRLAGRVGLVTGAGSGIGRGIAHHFVAEGARVVALDASADGLADLRADLGTAVVTTLGDVRSAEDNERAVESALTTYGALDVLVANAGIFDGMVRLHELSQARLTSAFEEIYAVNVLGYLLAARAALPALRRARGAIIFTVSNAGLHAGSGGGVLYSSSKHAVVGLVRQLAHELAPEVRVNGVAPGGTVTGLRVAAALEDLVDGPVHFADRDRAATAIRATNPLGIVPDVGDHVALYALLASSEARAITGEVISSDGGLAVRGLELGGDRT